MGAIIFLDIGGVSHGQSFDSPDPSPAIKAITPFLSSWFARPLDFSALEYFSQSVEMDPSCSRKDEIDDAFIVDCT